MEPLLGICYEVNFGNRPVDVSLCEQMHERQNEPFFFMARKFDNLMQWVVGGQSFVNAYHAGKRRAPSDKRLPDPYDKKAAIAHAAALTGNDPGKIGLKFQCRPLSRSKPLSWPPSDYKKINNWLLAAQLNPACSRACWFATIAPTLIIELPPGLQKEKSIITVAWDQMIIGIKTAVFAKAVPFDRITWTS